MSEIIVRPSLKRTRGAYTVVFIVLFFTVLGYTNSETLQQYPPWILLGPALLLIWPVRSHVRRRLTRLVLLDDKLRYETGFINKSTRTIPLSKIQDVRVDQTLPQRLLGTGNLSIEAAGGSPGIIIHDIDEPVRVGEHVLLTTRRQAGKGKGRD